MYVPASRARTCGQSALSPHFFFLPSNSPRACRPACTPRACCSPRSCTRHDQRVLCWRLASYAPKAYFRSTTPPAGHRARAVSPATADVPLWDSLPYPTFLARVSPGLKLTPTGRARRWARRKLRVRSRPCSVSRSLRASCKPVELQTATRGRATRRRKQPLPPRRAHHDVRAMTREPRVA